MTEAITLTQKQADVVKWAREMKKGHLDICSILLLLMSDKPFRDDEGTMEARKIYQGYNSFYKDGIIRGIVLDCYRLDNDFDEGDIVSNGEMVGYAGDIDFFSRTFSLYGRNDFNPAYRLGDFIMDDFKEID